MNNIKNIAIAAALLSAPFAASAQDAAINQNWYLQPSVGIMRPDAEWGIDKDDKALGLRFGKAISQDFDVQMGFSNAAVAKNGARYQQRLLGVDALYMFSRKAVRPFLLAGIGAEDDKVNPKNSFAEPSRTSPYVALGLGLQSQINDRWFFQTDLRNVHGMIRGDQLKPAKVNNQYLNFSLNYLFGGAPVPAPAPVVAPAPAPAPVIEAPAPVAAPVAAPAPAPRFEKVTMAATELFAFDSDKLAPSQPKLDDMAKLLNENTALTGIVITGHTDRLGSDKYNQKLSERRADAVKAYLVGKGVSADRLKAQGKGKTQPVVQCNDKKQKRADLIKCLEPNRRVEVEQITVERKVK